jgi:hypothetical protein
MWKKNKMKRDRKVERAIKKYFPGWKGKFWIGDGVFDMRTTSTQAYYDLYPHLTTAEADEQIIKDIMTIVRKYHPFSVAKGYEQHGTYKVIGE